MPTWCMPLLSDDIRHPACRPAAGASRNSSAVELWLCSCWTPRRWILHPRCKAKGTEYMMPYLDWGDHGGVTAASYVDTMACVGRFLKGGGPACDPSCAGRFDLRRNECFVQSISCSVVEGFD